MRSISKLICCIVLLCFSLNIMLSAPAQGWCKDVVACGNATDGDYNLLLKIRDPSRSGLQVLSIIPEGYKYTYHHPWTGKPMEFEVKRKFIGVVSIGDTIPNIVKAGMAFSNAGIAYGDADTTVNWKNPTKHGWDDFDWIRYACQIAETEEEAVQLLTEDVVKKMHAPSVPENLFVVGPKKAYVIEADVIHYDVKEINGVVVMSNYPKELWKTSLVHRFFAPRFDSQFEGFVRKGRTVRLGLGCFFGIKVVDVGNNWVVVRQAPFRLTRGNIIGSKIDFGKKYKINKYETETVGPFRVKLLDCNGKKAKISFCYEYKEWEEKMMEYIQPRYGFITVKDMINWSRLHKEDLDGLRGMCGTKEVYRGEGAMIYKIPWDNYEILSGGWFSANHPCSSIYVPIHICNNDIYDPYETREAAQLSLDLLGVYGHGNLSANFSKTENVFIEEIKFMEQISTDLLKNNIDVSDFLTITDMAMQRQGFLTEEIWLEASKLSNEQNKQEIRDIIANLWEKNYTFTLDKMKTAISDLKDISRLTVIREKIVDIALDICKSRIDAAGIIEKQSPDAEEEYKKGSRLIKQGEYESGFYSIQKAFTECNMLMKGQSFQDLENVEERDEKTTFLLQIMVIFLIIIILILILVFRKKRS